MLSINANCPQLLLNISFELFQEMYLSSWKLVFAMKIDKNQWRQIILSLEEIFGGNKRNFK